MPTKENLTAPAEAAATGINSALESFRAKAVRETSLRALELLRKLGANQLAGTGKLLAWKCRFEKRLRRVEGKLGRRETEAGSPGLPKPPLLAAEALP